MKINEIFCSLNGESTLSGLRTVFIRTHSCNLRCNYCDTMYAVEGNEFKDMTVEEIVKEVEKYKCKRITLTGGEPLLQKDSIDLIKALTDHNYHIEIETNGAVDVAPVKDLLFDNVTLTMDWKCPTSGELDMMIESNLGELDFDDVVKCVVGSKEDLDEMVRIKDKTNAQVFVSPVFGEIEFVDIANYLLDKKINDVRMQLQLHKFIWPVDMRGV